MTQHNITDMGANTEFYHRHDAAIFLDSAYGGLVSIAI